MGGKQAASPGRALPHPWQHLLKGAVCSTSDKDVGFKSLISNAQRSVVTSSCMFARAGPREEE